uniref:Probable proton-coupled zinc antiporter SLC30A3 n=1 Tax=Varanus komodoensis TaxID=61221 RepID=A0A8D2J4B0_VARKO
MYWCSPSLFAGPPDAFPGLPRENGSAEGPAAGLEAEVEACSDTHCHLGPCSPSQSQQKLQAQRKLGMACAVCCLFMIGEIVETLGALASVLSIWLVTGVLVYLASARIASGDYEIDAPAMLGTSACAVGVNVIMAYLLHQPGCPHSHGPGAGGYEPVGAAVRAAFVHVVGDLLQSIGVFVAAAVIYFEPRYKIADPVSTYLFSVFVLGSTLTILRDVFRVLMEGSPRGVEFPAVKELLLSIKGVKGAHSLHLWALTLSHHAVAPDADMAAVLQEATALLQSKFGFVSCTIQVERYLDNMATCRQCQDPQD